MRTLLACLVAFPLAAAVPAAAQNGAAAPAAESADCQWSYTGPTGPDRWWEICPQYALCRVGERQSPIELTDAQPADLPGLVFDYGRRQFTVVGEYWGQELQAKPPAAAEPLYLRVGGESYRLVQFHFHHPCEHCRNRATGSMELHLVHQNDLGEVAVVGVPVVEGAENAAFRAFVETIPPTGTPGGVADLDPLALLPPPAGRGYFRYAGSLTTPACAEGVRWHVLGQPLEVSKGDIDRFRSRYPYTARTLQERMGRPLLRSRD